MAVLNSEMPIPEQIRIYTLRAKEAYERSVAANFNGHDQAAEFHMDRFNMYSNYLKELKMLQEGQSDAGH